MITTHTRHSVLFPATGTTTTPTDTTSEYNFTLDEHIFWPVITQFVWIGAYYSFEQWSHARPYHMQLLLIACLSQSRWSGAQDLTLFLWAGSINSCRFCTLCISDQASWSCLHIAHQHRPVLHSITPMCHAFIRLMPIPAHIPQTHMHWSTRFRHSLRSELSIAKCHHDLVGRMSDHIIWSTMVAYDQVLNAFLVQQVVWNWFHIRIQIQVDVLVISYKWACSPGLSLPISATCLFVSRSGALSD